MLHWIKRWFQKVATKPAPATDDSVRADGGNSVADVPVSREQLAKLQHSAETHTKDEPGS